MNCDTDRPHIIDVAETPGDAGEDAALIALCRDFWWKWKQAERCHARFDKLAAELEARPDCPPDALPAVDHEAHERWEDFMRRHGRDAAYDATNEASDVGGRLARSIFVMPAAGLPGVLAKLKIVHAARGIDDDHGGGDPDLAAYQRDDQDWLQSIIDDCERLLREGGCR